MGRRPNALVSQYFIRGQKLTDASNRYSHTCRKCDKEFPKGRVEALVSHLINRCPLVYRDERQLIYEAYQRHCPDLHLKVQQEEKPTIPSASLPSPSGLPPLVDYATDLPAPFLPARDQDRLNTLAEASIAVGDPPGHDAVDDFGHGVAETDFMAQMQNVVDTSAFPTASAPQAAAEAVMYVSANVSHTSSNVDAAVNTAVASTPLVQAASAANEELEQFSANIPAQSALDQQIRDSTSDTISWGPTNAPNTLKFGNMTATMKVNDNPEGVGTLQMTAKTRSRGRFNDTRRKEVQEIRKMGACMRCRMLKKTCSDGTPCNGCKGVQSARVWKGVCIRARLADVFTLWSLGLFHCKREIDVFAAVRGLEQQRMEGRVEVRLFAGSDRAMTFQVSKYTSPLVRYKAPTNENIASHLRDQTSEPNTSDQDVWVLDHDGGISSTIGEYLRNIASECIAEEQLPFIKSTLRRAQDMVRQEEANGYAARHAQTGRSPYNLQNELLKNTVELWVATCVLTLRNPTQLEASYNPPEAPDNESTFASRNTLQAGQYTPIAAKSCELILTQIQAATEHLCLGLSKNIMNELERRLLQRSQVSGFATVISSVILLNCVERMSGYFRSHDLNPASPPRKGEASNTQDLLNEVAFLRPADWPLDKSPRQLWPQGEHFANFLISLLRQRKLPPQTKILANGRLIVSQDNAKVMTLIRSVKDQADDSNKLPVAWLNHLALQESDLVKMRDERLPAGDKGVRDWDMKFIAALLLPEVA